MYFVTVLNDVIEKKHFEEEYSKERPHHYCVGWSDNLEEAKELVKRNAFSVYKPTFYDMNQYIVIEYVPKGANPTGELKAWFAYDANEETWVEIEQPQEAYTKFNYSVG